MINKNQSGVTLVELAIAIAIIAVSVFAVISVFQVSINNSPNATIKKQVILIAESLMEEVLSKSFTKPDGGYSGVLSANHRDKFDAVLDYNGLTINGVTTMTGVPIAGLEQYSATISVSNSPLGVIPFSDVFLVQITVTGPTDSFVLKGYRINDE